MSKGAAAAICGLGFSTLSRKPVGTPRSLAVEAVRAALADSGLAPGHVDGLMITQSALASEDAIPLKIMNDLGFGTLRFMNMLEAKGSSVAQMIQVAAMAVGHGMAETIACVFADAPLTASRSAGAAFANASPLTGIAGWDAQYGLFGATGTYAMAARRVMALRGVTEKDLGAYAIACREWAARNPLAFLKEPLSMDQYLASRMIVEPLRLLDCAYPVNGGAAIIVTGAARARDLARPPVYIHGMGQGHSPMPGLAGIDPDIATGGAEAGRAAFAMAGIGPGDITQAQIYDAFSFTVMVALEDYRLPDGLPVNTGGGHLSSYYLQGMTPLSEAVIQGRGDGGARQCRNDAILVTNSGGRLENHAALVLSPRERLS
jgi:acetyl-CoA acetyltransferase